MSHTKAYTCELMDIPVEEYDNFVEKIKQEYDDNKSFVKSYRYVNIYFICIYFFKKIFF
jgi:hypothetical protein